MMDYVELCPVCNGKGEYEQSYNAGCGQGMYKDIGPCDYCSHPKVFMKGIGYHMKDGSEMPQSVINQLYVAGKLNIRKAMYSDRWC